MLNLLDPANDVARPRVLVRDDVDIASATETEVFEFVGEGTGCEVWFKVPTSWAASTLRLYARLGEKEVLVRQQRLSSVATLIDGDLCGIAVRFGGKPCDGFRFTVTPPGEVSDAAFTMRVNAVDCSGSPDVILDGRGYMAASGFAEFTDDASDPPVSIAYLWNGSGRTVQIRRFTLSFNTAGVIASLRATRITAQDGTPGGTTPTPIALHPDDGAAAAVFRVGATGAPTRASLDALIVPAVGSGSYVWEADRASGPIVLPASPAQGFEVRFVAEDGVGEAVSRVAACFEWIEI